MLAVCTTDSLAVVSPATLKKLASSAANIPISSSFKTPPTASTWASDNSCLYVASPSEICKYDAPASSAPSRQVAALTHPVPANALLSKDGGATVIYASHNEVVVLDAASRKVSCRLDSHEDPVALLSLSNDASLLASSSTAGDVHVHNLSEASHSVLRGPSKGSDAVASDSVTALAFHTHARTKLLLGLGSRLLVYDTAKPGTPVKTVPLSKTSGHIVAIACSPFSKTLVAVACSAGSLCLVDLEKEKGLFRTFSLHVSITSMVFSVEGAALYVGTEDGKLLVLDLRALDKPAKPIKVGSGSEGATVVCMSVQRKLKPGEGLAKSPITRRRVVSGTAATSPADKHPHPASPPAPSQAPERPKTNANGTVPRTRTISAHATPPKPRRQSTPVDNSKSTPPTPSASRVRRVPAAPAPPVPPVPPVRARTTSAASAVSSPSSRVTSSSRASRAMSSATSTTSVSPPAKVNGPARAVSPRKAFSPPKSPLGGSMAEESEDEHAVGINARVESLMSPPNPPQEERDREDLTTKPALAGVRQTSTRTRTISESATSPRARAPATRVVSGSGPKPAQSKALSGDKKPSSSGTSKPKEERTRPRTQSSRSAPAQPRTSSRPASRAAAVVSPAPTLSPIPPVPPLPLPYQNEEQLTAINIKWTASRTPSPDFASVPPVPGISVNGQLKGREGKKNRETDAGPGRARRLGLDVLGLGVPEMRRWVRSGRTGTDDDDDDETTESGSGEGDEDERKDDGEAGEPESEVMIERIEVLGGENGAGRSDGSSGSSLGAAELDEPTIKMTVQISPRRPTSASAGTSHQWPSAGSPYNVLKSPQIPSSNGAGYLPNANPAHDLLHTLIRDALYDFRRETKSEIIGLHLDLVKMSRGWRKELRESLDRWGRELHTLKEENERLREENERLRRGY